MSELTGGCGCGAVRFEIDAPLVSAVYCHCTRCQRRSGAGAAASARVEPGSVRIVFGEDTAYAAAWEPLPDDGLPRHPERMPPAG